MKAIPSSYCRLLRDWLACTKTRPLNWVIQVLFSMSFWPLATKCTQGCRMLKICVGTTQPFLIKSAQGCLASVMFIFPAVRLTNA